MNERLNINFRATFLFLALIILFIGEISAACDEGQININNANAEELDKLTGIGPAIAQNIINARPYKTLDDLVNANGIGKARLEAIKSQGLACVENEEKEKKSEVLNGEENNESEIVSNSVSEETNEISTPKTLDAINLQAQTIKSTENNIFSIKKYTVYGLIAFGILISALLFLRSKKYKTEFK